MTNPKTATAAKTATAKAAKPKAATENTQNADAAITQYARDAVSNPESAIRAGIASESGHARAIMFATAARHCTTTTGVAALTQACIKDGFKSLGFVGASAPELKKNDVARTRAWVYAIGKPDAAALLAPLSTVAVSAIGKVLVAQENAQAKDESGDTPAPDVAAAIEQVRDGLKAKARDLKSKKGDDARFSQDDFRTAKALGGVSGISALDPAKPVAAPAPAPASAPATAKPAGTDGETVPAMPAVPSDVPASATGDAPRNGVDAQGQSAHYNAARDRMASLMTDLLTHADEIEQTAKGISLKVAGARVPGLLKDLKAAQKALRAVE